MVEGISGRVKRYVSVTARMDEDGRVRPLSIQWYDGKTYPIDEVKDVRRASSRKVGGDGICYTPSEPATTSPTCSTRIRAGSLKRSSRTACPHKSSHILSKTPVRSHCDNLSQRMRARSHPLG